eukprot:190435-Alexandrium_andersonii.AAC.1
MLPRRPSPSAHAPRSTHAARHDAHSILRDGSNTLRNYSLTMKKKRRSTLRSMKSKPRIVALVV